MYNRRRHRHNLDSVAIGRYAGEESTTENTVSVGRKAGYSLQAQYAIAVGDRAGEETQGLNAICIGMLAGQTSQSTFGIAIGDQAGRMTQGANTIAIGSNAGYSLQSTLSIAVGDKAGQTSQGANAIAIGSNAGQTSQGANAIAIGSNAGLNNQPENSIIISTSDIEIVAKKKGLYIDPIRKFDDREARPETVKEGNVLSYNYQNDTTNATKEVVTGFPRLPAYPNDAEVLLAFTEAKKDFPPPILGPLDKGTMYFDSTKNKIKVYDGAKWTALADEEDIKKLMAAAAGAGRSGGSGSNASGGRTPGVYIPGSDESPFVTGPSIGLAQIMITDPVTGEKRRAVDGADFYWDRGGGVDAQPVFYSDLEVVSVERPPPNRPGYVSTNFDNGHSRLEQIPLEEWNPPLAAFGSLPSEQRREFVKEYADSRGYAVMLGGDSGNVDAPDTFESDAFRSFLESKGVTG